MKLFVYKPGLLPKTWDQLTTRQLEQLAKLVLRYNTKADIAVRAVFAFMGMRLGKPVRNLLGTPTGAYVVVGKRKRYFVTPLLTFFLTDIIDFIFSNNQINPRRLVNPYPLLRLGFFRKKTLYGPANGLANITLNEWIQVEVARAEFERTSSPEHLYRMAAIMWRPKGKTHPDGDIRISSILDSLPERERLMRRYLAPHRLKVIMWYYSGCLNYLTYRYNLVLSASNGGSSGASPSSTFDNFMDMVNTMAKDDPTKIQQVRSLALYDALHNIQKIIIQQNEQKNERNRV